MMCVCRSDWRTSTSSGDQSSSLPAPLGPSELRQGDRALWTCPAAAALAARRGPGPGARWTLDGEEIVAAGRVTLHEDGALEVDDVRASDAGQYRCGVETAEGDADDEVRWSDALTLTIVDDPPGKS